MPAPKTEPQAERIKTIDQLVEVNNRVVEMMNAVNTVGQIGGFKDLPLDNRVNMVEQMLGTVASALNMSVNVLKEQEALLDRLGEMVDELQIDAEQLDIPGEDA